MSLSNEFQEELLNFYTSSADNPGSLWISNVEATKDSGDYDEAMEQIVAENLIRDIDNGLRPMVLGHMPAFEYKKKKAKEKKCTREAWSLSLRKM